MQRAGKEAIEKANDMEDEVLKGKDSEEGGDFDWED